MPSDVSMKIAAAWYKATTTLEHETIRNLADHLDSMGVGDAFDACEAVLDGDNIPLCSDSCGCSFSKAREALRKAGMV